MKIDVRIHLSTYKPPFFIGSMLRGVLGNALKQVSCINPSYQCEGCFALRECLYYKFYEEKNTFHAFRLGIIMQPKTLDFSLYLFENSVKTLPYMLSAIKKGLEELGVGKEQAKQRITTIKIAGQTVYDGVEFLSLNAISPSRLEIDGFSRDVTLQFNMPIRIKEHNRLARKGFELPTLINSIHHRYRQLKGEESSRLGYQIHGEIVESHLKFVEMQRFSSRQKSRMNLGGLKGTIKITGLDKRSYVYLKIGEVIGAGKQTVFGLGSYVVKEEK